MATKKQKREAGIAKAAELAAKLKEEGLEAQSRDRYNREIEGQVIAAEVNAVNARYQRILDEATPEDWRRAQASIGFSYDEAIDVSRGN